MYQIVLYALLNFLGFFTFLFIWNRIPKPKPFDYTTIPGLKLEVASAEALPALSIEPGTSTAFVSDLQGHLEDIIKLPTFRHFLEFCNICYGPLASFYWGGRYVVTIAKDELVAQMEKESANLLAVCPLAIGSVLNGDGRVWTRRRSAALRIRATRSHTYDHMLDESVQEQVIRKGPVSQCADLASISELSQLLRCVGETFRADFESKKSIREILSRPLIVVFDKEIDIDAHPIPPFVPIVIHVGGLIQKWTTADLWRRYTETLFWIPGLNTLETFESTIKTKIKLETKH